MTKEDSENLEEIQGKVHYMFQNSEDINKTVHEINLKLFKFEEWRNKKLEKVHNDTLSTLEQMSGQTHLLNQKLEKSVEYLGEIKSFSDVVITHILDYEYKFSHYSRRFNSVMLGVIAVSVVIIAFNI
jgi:hypothetical protein